MLARRSKTESGLPTIADLRNEMDQFFDRFWETKLTPFGFFTEETTGDWLPAINVTEKDGTIVVEAEVPGVDPKDIEVTVHENLLTIRGEKEETKEEQEKSFHRSERRFGSFLRHVQLPEHVDEENVKATSTNGVLHIELRKSPTVEPKRIPISSKS